jgi:hypothetical protein
VKRKIPFEFILDYLHPLDIIIKPMFGCHAFYSGGKILVIVRKKEDHTDANGIWIATDKIHHASLKKQLPSIHSVYILSDGKGETNWQMIHEDDDNFEEASAKLCRMIVKGDERIGRIPNGKKKSKTQKSKKTNK